MQNIRVKLLMHGNVQGIGYRAYVKQVARNLGIRGHAKNLDDGSVEIYCEAPSRETLDAFKQKITVKGDTENPFSLHVKNLQEFGGKSAEFGPPKNAFKAFWIDYGDTLDIQQEMLEKTEIGGLMLQGMDKTLQGMDKSLHGMDTTLHEFKDQTVGNFHDLDKKYGSISTQLSTLDKINENLEKLTAAIQQAIKSINPNH